jgi:hypothetical protein
MDPDSEGNTDSHPISTQGYHLHISQFCKKGQAEAKVPSSSGTLCFQFPFKATLCAEGVINRYDKMLQCTSSRRPITLVQSQ